MFKSVVYSGFEGRPELKLAAGKAISVLAGETQSWHDNIEVVCKAHADKPTGIEFCLTLNLPAGSGRGSQYLSAKDMEDQERLLRYCRDVWDQALGDYLKKRKPVWDEMVHQHVEI